MRSVNTLRDEAEGETEPPVLDEFDGMSITDIAHNIIAWPEGSEEQTRAIAAIRARAPGIGHNRPPLAEQLELDTATLRGEVDALITIAESSKIIDDESAGKVNDLIQKITAKLRAIDDARKKRNEPYAMAVGIVNATYNAMAGLLRVAHVGADENGGLRGMLTAYDNKKRAEVAAERAKAEAEQKAREAEAAEAQRKADEAREQDNFAGAITADLHAASLADQAERAAIRAEAIRPEPIRSHLGTTSRPRVIVHTIDDPAKAFAWARKTAGLGENVLADLDKRIGAYLRSRAVGVAAVERGVTIPGVTAKTELGHVSSRR